MPQRHFNAILGGTLLASFLLLPAAPAQAIAVQVGMGVVNFTTEGNLEMIEPGSPYTTLPGRDVGFRFTNGVKTVTLFDDTGILLSALGTGANAYTAQSNAAASAQRDANNKARRTGKDATVSYSYSYKTVNAPGAKAYITYGKGAVPGGEITLDGKTFIPSNMATEATILKVGAPWPAFHLSSLPGLSGLRRQKLRLLDPMLNLGMEVNINKYAVNGTVMNKTVPVPVKREVGLIGMPVTMMLDFPLLPGLNLAPTVGYDIVSAMSVLARPKTGSHGFTYGLVLSYAPVDWAFASLDLRGFNSNLLGEKFQEQTAMANVGVGYSF